MTQRPHPMYVNHGPWSAKYQAEALNLVLAQRAQERRAAKIAEWRDFFAVHSERHRAAEAAIAERNRAAQPADRKRRQAKEIEEHVERTTRALAARTGR